MRALARSAARRGRTHNVLRDAIGRRVLVRVQLRAVVRAQRAEDVRLQRLVVRDDRAQVSGSAEHGVAGGGIGPTSEDVAAGLASGCASHAVGRCAPGGPTHLTSPGGLCSMNLTASLMRSSVVSSAMMSRGWGARCGGGVGRAVGQMPGRGMQEKEEEERGDDLPQPRTAPSGRSFIELA